MTPSADGRSLPGASSTEPPPSFARVEAQRRRNLLFVAFAGFLVLAGVVGFMFGRDRQPRAAALAPLPPPAVAQPVEAQPNPPPPAPPVEAAPSATVPATAEPPPAPSVTAPVRPAGGRRTAPAATSAKPATSAPPRKGPFVSPIRNPGF
jgi:hypothetical protein